MSAISKTTTPSRRTFLKGSAATTAGLVIGFYVPLLSRQAIAQGVATWVVVQPDDKIIIRIARSEMGQGSLTGLAQMVAEELECDWAKVSTEYPTPGQSLARKRVWGDFSTGGSRGIRGSARRARRRLGSCWLRRRSLSAKAGHDNLLTIG